MPVIRRKDWLQLTPTEKLLHQVNKQIERLDDAQALYDASKAAGKVKKPIPFFEDEAGNS